MTKNEKLETVLRTLSDKKGVNIMAFDVDKKSGYTDFIVFVTGTSTTFLPRSAQNVASQ